MAASILASSFRSATQTFASLAFISLLPLSLPANADALPGQIVLFAGECPGGYLPADGSSIDPAAYPELTSVVLDSYGTGEDMGTINLPTADSSAVGRTYNYVYAPDDTQSLRRGATAYLVKVRDDRDSLKVVEVSVGGRGGSNDPQAFVRFVTSFEKETGTTVENYAIRTNRGFALPNGDEVPDREKDSYWFGDYCSGNGNCNKTNKGLVTIALSDLEEGDLQGGFPTPPPRQTAGDEAMSPVADIISELPEDFAPFQPTYCVAVGGDTAPLVEVGLEYVQGSGKSGTLAFSRIDVSGYTDDELATLPAGCFENGDLCLDQLAATNPGISRPNIAFRLVGENICTAYETVSGGGGCGTTTYNWSSGAEFCDLVSPYTTNLLIALGAGPNTSSVSCITGAFKQVEGQDAPDLDRYLCEKLGGVYSYSINRAQCTRTPELGIVEVDNTVTDVGDFCLRVAGVVTDDEGLCGVNQNVPPKIYAQRCVDLGGSVNTAIGNEFPRCEPPGYASGSFTPFCAGDGSASGSAFVTQNLQRLDSGIRVSAPDSGGSSASLPYPAELFLSGLQISRNDDYPTDEEWGNDFDAQRQALLNGGSAEASPYAYITKRDENGRPGFVAADLVDERTLILENRNTIQADFFYRVQAQCGTGEDAYNAYYDPVISTSGGGGFSLY